MAICIEKGGITMMHNNFRLPISEELLGAYLEGSLSIEEAQMVEHIMRERGGFHDFVNELQSFDDVLLSNNLEDIPNFEIDFELPDTSSDADTQIIETFPMVADVDIACAICDFDDIFDSPTGALEEESTQNVFEDRGETELDIDLDNSEIEL